MNELVLLACGVLLGCYLAVGLWYRLYLNPWPRLRLIGIVVFQLGVVTVVFVEVELLGLGMAAVGTVFLLLDRLGVDADDSGQDAGHADEPSG